MTQDKKARHFANLHIPGDPLVLYNIWDAGSAQAIAEVGASAVATSSWSMAVAQGYADGENIPLEFVLQVVARITQTVELPASVDFEGAYTDLVEDVAKNVARVISTGVIGVNIEDQIVNGTGLYTVDTQCQRLSAARQAAQDAGLPLFINARTDLFLAETDRKQHSALITEAVDRSAAYLEAGANGFFVPGLVDAHLIAKICESISLPVNIMVMDGVPPNNELASLGVARISYGPGSYFDMKANLASSCREAFR